MSIFDTKIGEHIHHAYIIKGEDKAQEDLKNFLESRGIKISVNPNILYLNFESFSIDNANELKIHQSEKSIDEGKKIFIIKTKSISHEATNALLKILEEPTKDTHFFFIIPNTDTISDTLLSRVHIIETLDSGESLHGLEFMKSNFNKRLEIISELIKTHKDTDETSAPLRSSANKLINECEEILHSKGELKKEDVFKYKELIKARKYLSIPGSAVKMILEHLAIVL